MAALDGPRWALGSPGGALGGPWGALGGPGGNLGDQLLRKSGLAKSLVSLMNGYIWALGGSLGDLGWGKFFTKAGEGEGNGDRGTHDKRKTKQEGAGKQKGAEKCITIIERSHPGGLLLQKVHSRAGAGGVFTNCPRAKEKAQNRIYSKGVAAKWAPGGAWGDLGGPLRGPCGVRVESVWGLCGVCVGSVW